MTLILKHLKTLKTLQHFSIYSDHSQGARSFLVKVTEFKITKNIKGPLWQCGSIRVVCMYGVLCGDVSWKLEVQLTSPHRTPYILQFTLHLHTERHTYTPHYAATLP